MIPRQSKCLSFKFFKECNNIHNKSIRCLVSVPTINGMYKFGIQDKNKQSTK